MRILFVTLYPLEINTSVRISNIGLITGLLENGHDVDLMMPNFFKEAKNFDNTLSIDARIRVIRIGENSLYKKFMLTNHTFLVKRLLQFVKNIYKKISILDSTSNLIKLSKDKNLYLFEYDYVISSSDPKSSHVFVKKMIKNGLVYKKWIQHWGDPLSIDIAKNNIYPRVILKHYEKNLLKLADRIVYVSPFTATKQKQIFHNFKDKIIFQPLPYSNRIIYNKTHNKNVVLGYFGDYHSKIRDIKPIYDFCRKNSEFRLVVAGNSDLILDQHENIQIFSRLHQNDIEKLIEKCDILVSICNLKGTQIPGKIYYYAGTNKNILVLNDGEIKNDLVLFLNSYTDRFIIADNNYVSIENTLQKIFLREVFPQDSLSPKSITYEIVKSLGENNES